MGTWKGQSEGADQGHSCCQKRWVGENEGRGHEIATYVTSWLNRDGLNTTYIYTQITLTTGWGSGVLNRGRVRSEGTRDRHVYYFVSRTVINAELH